jgi:serine/threonine protein kinase
MDIATGLNYLHSVGLVHGNLCMVSPVSLSPWPSILRCLKENILVANCGRAHLADAGVNTLASRAFCDATKPVPVAWMYKAPEELQIGIRDQRTDVYSFACVVYTVNMLNFMTPYSALILFGRASIDTQWKTTIPATAMYIIPRAWPNH